MKRLLLIPFSLLVLVFTSCSQPTSLSPATVIIVRHAEKVSDEENSPLNETGFKRAQNLAAALEKAGVSAVYSSQFERNKDTAKPLAEKAQLAVTEMPVNLQNPGDYAKNLAQEIISKHAGQNVLVVGHGNTIASTIENIIGEPVNIGDVQYSDIFIVTARGTKSEEKGKFVKAQYGLK